MLAVPAEDQSWVLSIQVYKHQKLKQAIGNQAPSSGLHKPQYSHANTHTDVYFFFKYFLRSSV